MNPEVSLFMLLGGFLLAYVEFLRPGSVLPGVLGGVAIIWAIQRLSVLGTEGVKTAIFSASPLFWGFAILWAAITFTLVRVAIRARQNKVTEQGNARPPLVGQSPQ